MSRFKYLLFFLLILILPVQLGFHWWPEWSLVNGVRVDYLSPTLYASDTVVVALCLTNLSSINKHKKILILLFLFALLNSIFSAIPLLSLYKWLKFIEFLSLGIVIYENRTMVTRVVKKALPFPILYTCLIAILQWMNNGSLNGIFYWLGERKFTIQTPGIALSKIGETVSLRPYATLPHPNALAGFLLLSLAVYLSCYSSFTRRGLYILVPVLSVVFLTQSLGVMVAIGCALVFLLLTKNGKYKHPLVWKLIVVEFFLLSVCSLWAVQLISVSPFMSTNSRERLELIYLSGIESSQHPVVGNGFGTFISLIPHFSMSLPEIYRMRATSWLQPVHNVPLLILSETGLLGLSLLFVSIAILPASAPLLFVLVTALFDHYWITLQSTSLILTIFLALSLKRSHSNSHVHSSH